MELSDVSPKHGQVQRLYCHQCGGYLDLTFGEFKENVSGIDINIAGLPYLHCPKCNLYRLPDDSRVTIIHLHEQATKRGLRTVNITRNKSNQEYGFSTVSFMYDSDDHKYIPGLKRPFDEGYLTPVFFNKEVLLKYDASPTYRLSFASTTYGEIRQGENFSIPFGLNKSGKAIMWLGDVARLPEAEQYYLRSENIESDHSIGSEFYDGQIEAKFTDLSQEDTLFKRRSEFLEVCFKRFGEKLAHLDEEVYNLAITFNGPIVDSDKERRHVADTMNKIYIESFDNKALRRVLGNLGDDRKNSGRLKRLQRILEHVTGREKASNLMSPFDVLQKLRDAYSHLGSKEGSEEELANVKLRLGLSSEAGLFEIYESLIDALSKALHELTRLITRST
jgi:hypothetical protein